MFGIRALSSALEPLNDRSRGSRLRSRAGRLAATTGVSLALVAIAGVPAALGASPQVNHFRDVSTDVDPDFCGTGKQIDLAFNVRTTEWLAPHRAAYKATSSGTIT